MDIWDSYPKPIVFGHRGASGYEFENTIPSFEKAIDQGADGLETDAWLLADGEIVLNHDKAVHMPGSETTSNISSLTLKQVKEITLPNKSKIPTISEFFDQFAKRTAKSGKPLLFSIDLQDLKVGPALIPILNKYNLLDRVVLCGNVMLHLKKTRQADAKVKLIASNQEEQLRAENFGPNGKLTALNLYAFNIQCDNVRPKYQQILSENHLKYYVWDLHTEESLKKSLPNCPDAIYSNFPDIALKMRDQICKK